MKTRYTLLTLITIAGLAADQATKIFIDKSMSLYQSIPVIDNFFHITYLRNRGAAFSFLASSPWRLPFFITVSLVALVAIMVVYHKLRDEQKLAQISLAMIFSGAIGNLLDRVRMGEVIDFLDVHWYSHHWPAFNVADSLICVGVAFMALDLFQEERRAK